jgi:hypothetical protein
MEILTTDQIQSTAGGCDCTCVQNGPWVRSWYHWGCVNAPIVCQLRCEDWGWDDYTCPNTFC